MLPGSATERDVGVPILLVPPLTGLVLRGGSGGGGGSGRTFVHAPGQPPAGPSFAAAERDGRGGRGPRAGPGRSVPTASGRAPGQGAGASGGSGLSGWMRGGGLGTSSWRSALGGIGMGAGVAGGGGMFCGPAKADLLRLFPLPGRRKKAPRKGDQKNVLIMMSNTGGGHKASAEALQQAFQEEFGDGYKITIVDMWKQHTPPPFNRLCDSYSFLVRHGFLWRLTYAMLQPRAVHYPYFGAVRAAVAGHLSAAFDAYDPDLVVSVHPLMQHIPIRVLEARARASGVPAPAFSTVVTDFTTCHNTWFHPEVSRCFVPTDYCRNLALAMGVPPARITVHGLPIRPIFSKRLPAKAALRKKLGLLRDAPAVLLVGGGEGMGALEATVRELAARLGGSAQVAVICGRNRRLLARVRGGDWGATHVVGVGFVDNVHEWMAACDVIITKAGPGTIAEALISGLPILLNGNVPCQEEGNIPYVVENGVGAFETDPARIADILAAWLAPGFKAEFDAMARRSRALGRPRAVYNIARDLAALADEAAERRAGAAAAAAEANPAAKKACCGCGGKKGALPKQPLVVAAA